MEDVNYYAVIPANVRYDEELTPNAKLLYAEITALSNKYGCCWASNNYFAKLYKTTPVTVSRWIRTLKEKGYIITEIIYKEGTNEIDKRYIYICYEGINKNDNRGINKIVKENNTSINITSINNMNEREIREINELFNSFLEESL